MQQSLTTKLFGEKGTKALSSRRGAILLGGAAALLAAILLIVYVNRYRNSLRANVQPTPVLVAKQLIQKGTPVATMTGLNMYELRDIPKKDVKDGAVYDPTTIKGLIAVSDIVPGQQFTTADFTATPTSAVPTQITGPQRAVAVSLDGTRGLSGQLGAGDHVDIYVGMDANVGGVQTPIVTLLFPNVTIISSSTSDGGVGGSSTTKYVLRLRTDQIGKVTFAADHGQLWFVARPSSGATPTKPSVVTAQSLLFPRVNVGR